MRFLYHKSKILIPNKLPIIPVRETIIFPSMVIPLYFDQERVIEVLSQSMIDNKPFVLVNININGDIDILKSKGLFKFGSACRVIQMIRMIDKGIKVVVEGLCRIKIKDISIDGQVLEGEVEEVREKIVKNSMVDIFVQNIRALFNICVSLGKSVPPNVIKMVNDIDDPSRLSDLIVVYLDFSKPDQQRFLEMADPFERLKEIFLYLSKEIQILQTRARIGSESNLNDNEANPNDRQAHASVRNLQREIRDEDPHTMEIRELKKRMKRTKMPLQVAEVASKEISRLERMNPASAEYTVARTYIDYLLTIPWEKGTEDNLDINRAEKILDEDHYGLKKVKSRILEFLAVRKLKNDMKGPILSFIGPPGVGKTSLGKSIARAMGRKFIRISLGGMRDEADIRGHRRTYVGALPGRIIQEIKRVDSNNPVFMLDEVDKIGHDFRGDPAAALLEVLDPEQNFSFTDHYIDIPFDLSKVMFITTANNAATIPSPLKDRMEIINIPGYTYEEKLNIAFDFLIPKQIKENGLEEYPITFSREAVKKIIMEYTKEAGLRNLEREIASILRKVAKEVAQGEIPITFIDVKEVEKFLGPRKFFQELAGEKDLVGVATGLAWTESGGDIIFIEATKMRGERGLVLTGSLGDVMKESAQAALSYIRTHHKELNIDEDFYNKHDIHIHVPAGAIPKDGPSAGIAIAISIISLLINRAVRRDIAMTGEITLTGRILPVGGVKEKVLAAKRAGIKKILLPQKNRPDIEEFSNDVKKGIKFIFLENIDQALKYVLV